MSPRARGILFIVLGLAGFAVALFSTRLQFMGVGIGLIFFFLAGTVLSNATQIAKSLRPWVKKPVEVEVWGMPLPTSSEKRFEIDSISAFGAGLLIHLRPASGGPRSLLKIAQPRSAILEEGRIEITQARYVQWASRKIKPARSNMPALVLRS